MAMLQRRPSFQVEEADPLSPVTAAVRQGSKNKPTYALIHAPDFQIQAPDVHEGSMRRSSSSPGTSRTPGAPAATLLGSRNGSKNLGEKMVIRQTGFGGRSSSKSEVRTLSKEEIEDQNQKAVEWFQNARAINQRRQSVDDMDYTIAEVRRMRAEKAKKEAEEAAERAKKEADLLAKGGRGGSRKNTLTRPATIGDGPALPALANNLKLGMLKGLRTKEPAKEDGASGSEPAEEGEQAKKGVNFLEKFGYGVKANKFKAAVSAVAAANKFNLVSKMGKPDGKQYADIKAGGGDSLLEKLQKRKEEKEEQQKAAAAEEKARQKAEFYRKAEAARQGSK